MNKSRTIEDKLREEYFNLLPDLYKLKELLETEIKYALKDVINRLQGHERIRVSSRIKECESAITKLRRQQKKGEGKLFEDTKDYYLLDLKDLVGVRILYFPDHLRSEIENSLAKRFSDWSPNHTFDNSALGKIIALKYQGILDRQTPDILVEYQIVPLMIGLFWEVEHFAFYKPHPNYKGITNSLEMKDCIQGVYEQFETFEKIFAEITQESSTIGV